MSKAEDRAWESYPIDPIVLRELRTDYRDLRHAFTKGYHQAEKDNELTWKDIKLLDKIFMNEKIMSGLILGKNKYEEILKRFKEEKEKIDN